MVNDASAGNMAVMGAPAAQMGNVFANAAVLALNAYQNTSIAALTFGWQPLDATALGLAPSGRFGTDSYTLRDGVYVATDAENSAVAHVYTGALNGVRTLAVAFRGTDEVPGDIAEHRTFTTHYAHFEPLIDAIETYLAGAGSGIERVLVTGHSLGSAMVATAMIAEGWANDPRYLGVAFSAHGTDASLVATAPAPVSNLVNFSHTQDPLLLASDPRGLPADALGTPLNALSQVVNEVGYEPKARVGTDIWIDTGNAAQALENAAPTALGDPVGAEHRMPALLDDVTLLAERGQLDPSTLLSSAGPRFFYVASGGNDNIAQDTSFASDTLNQRFFPAQDFDQRIFGLGGDDRIAGAGGNDVIDGGPGTDVAIYRGAIAEYTIVTGSSGTTVTHNAIAESDGSDTLMSVEYLSFANGVVPLGAASGPVPDLVASAREPAIELAGIPGQIASAIDDLLS